MGFLHSSPAQQQFGQYPIEKKHVVKARGESMWGKHMGKAHAKSTCLNQVLFVSKKARALHGKQVIFQKACDLSNRKLSTYKSTCFPWKASDFPKACGLRNRNHPSIRYWNLYMNNFLFDKPHALRKSPAFHGKHALLYMNNFLFDKSYAFWKITYFWCKARAFFETKSTCFKHVLSACAFPTCFPHVLPPRAFTTCFFSIGWSLELQEIQYKLIFNKQKS